MALSKNSDLKLMSFAIDKELKELAEEEAKRLGLTLSAYIRMVLAERLRNK